MKKATYFIVSAAAVAIGILLLIFSRDPLYVDGVSQTLRGITIAEGIIFSLGGLVGLIYSFRPKRDAEGVAMNRPWYATLMPIASIFWGVLLLVFNQLFTYNFYASIGVSLILAAICQTIWISNSARPYGASGWWYVIPFATLCAGVVDLTLSGLSQTLAYANSTACIVSGILLVLYGCNGFSSLNRRKRIQKNVIESVNNIAAESDRKKVS